jgi:DNA-binding SARP family transcriptional activator
LDIEIRVFGSIEVVGPAGRLTVSDFPSRKAKQVCEMLAVAGGRPVSKDQLLDALWVDRLPRDPGATVEQAVSMLRSSIATVAAVPAIVTERGRYRLDGALVDIDLLRFNAWVETAGRADGRERIDALQRALAVATGDLLEDEPVAAWAETERERYRRRVERVALDLARLALAHDEATIAHEAAERAHQASSVVLEEAYAADISALVRLGRRHEARSLMRDLERRLADEESSEPSAETAALRPLLRSLPRRAAPGSHPTITTTLARPKGRARELPMLGRAEAMTTIASSIEAAANGTSEMVLVEGAAGSGKTRLLRAVADGPARAAAAHLVTFSCGPSDLVHPMLAAGRLLRVLARAARLRTMPTIDEAVAPMFGRLADTLDRLGPTLLLIDDLHLADPASIAVLASIVAPEAVQSLCLVAARRPTSPGTDALPRGAVRRAIQLGALSPADVDQLGIDGAWAETGGHPASLAMCIEAARGGGALSQGAIASVLARIDEAGELSRYVLELTAALTQPFDITDVAFTARLARETVADLLQRAVELGILKTVKKGQLAFAGDITRRVLLAMASGPQIPD